MNSSHTYNPHGGDAKATALSLGLKKIPDTLIDFSVNINPLGPPPCMSNILDNALDPITQYPDITAKHAEAALAKAHGVDSSSIIAGNGSTEILGWIFHALNPIWPGWTIPCYAGYNEAAQAAGLNGEQVVTLDEDDFDLDFNKLNNNDIDLLFLSSPNNPTGMTLEPEKILNLVKKNPKRTIVLDESFIDFLPHTKKQTLINTHMPKNLIILKSLTKFFAIPGIRLGIACSHPSTIAKLRTVRLPWSVNSIAQEAGMQLYNDKQYVKESRALSVKLRKALEKELLEIPGYTVFQSEANFILVKIPEEQTASEIQTTLLEKGILIRSCAHIPGLGEEYIRLAARPENEIIELVNQLRIMADMTPLPLPDTPKNNPPAEDQTKEDETEQIDIISATEEVEPPLNTESISNETTTHSSIMVVGTMSHSGKSIITAGLCRYFKNKGRDVAPFKAQNMALNSFVTKEGGEMGRAQVVQATAADVTPHTDMNPVLLKPVSESGSQVIVNGHAIGNYAATEYYAMKSEMKKAATDAYDRLSAKHELIILEGAGSPAEINLQNEDFVNLAMAEHANSAALLVADIDRGGVFASIHGTLSLIPEKHRKLIKGIIINKFRGDKLLLTSGIKQIEDITGIPVLGILPFIKDLNIEDEDSLSLDDKTVDDNNVIDILVIRLPRISNYTDFKTLEDRSGVTVRYENEISHLGAPDLVIIPGTKNTRADLQFLNSSGIGNAIEAFYSNKVPIFGICGGYQILGSRVVDPSGIEGEQGDDIGLNLLPLTTVLEPRKELAQVKGITSEQFPFAKPGTEFEGYEIHAGRTVATVRIDRPLTVTRRLNEEANETTGAISDDRLIFGSYIHGIFDKAQMRDQLLDWLCNRKGVILPSQQEEKTEKDNFDRLTEQMTEHLNMSSIEAMVETE